MKNKRRDYRLWFYWDDPSQDICVEYFGKSVPRKLIKKLCKKMKWAFVYYEVKPKRKPAKKAKRK